MSTRCRIGILESDGKVKSIYCHHDGYPKGVGEILKIHYNNPDDVEKLIALGDISILGVGYDSKMAKRWWQMVDKGLKLSEEEIDKICNMVVPYKDRGETNYEARVDKNVETYMEKLGNSMEEYTYLFREDYSGVYKWFVAESPYFKALEEEDEEM